MTTNHRNQTSINQIINEVTSKFPFDSEYITRRSTRTNTVISLLMSSDPSNTSILSIGGGACDLEAILSKIGYSVTVVDDLDTSWHKIGENRKRIREFADRMDIELIESKVGSGALESKYDIVITLDVIEHLTNPREFLNTIGSSLKERGFFILSTPNGLHLANRIKALLGIPITTSAGYFFWKPGDFRDHLKEYTSKELETIVEWANYEIEEHRFTDQYLQMRKHTADSENDHVDKAASILYSQLTKLHPHFKDSQFIRARKTEGWEPVDTSIERFSQYYPKILKHNLDRLSNREIMESIEDEKNI